MTISGSELKLMKSATVSDASSNGGRISANQVTSGVAQNLFATAQEAERLAGSTKYRKAFWKIANDADEAGIACLVYLEHYTIGADQITFFPATQTDTQSGLTGAERQYGCAQLNGNVSIGATSMVVLLEDSGVEIFEDGDMVRISDKTDISDESGNTEFVTIVSVSDTADTRTITFTPALENAYLASETRVASVHEAGTIEATVDNLVVTSVGDGDFNIANLFADGIGGMEDTFTCTFTSATAFDIVGAIAGSVGSGSTGAGAAPNNASFSKPYFTMQAAGFTGTWQAGDTIVFQTHPAAEPIWLKRRIDPGTTPELENEAIIAFKVETA